MGSRRQNVTVCTDVYLCSIEGVAGACIAVAPGVAAARAAAIAAAAAAGFAAARGGGPQEPIRPSRW